MAPTPPGSLSCLSTFLSASPMGSDLCPVGAALVFSPGAWGADLGERRWGCQWSNMPPEHWGPLPLLMPVRRDRPQDVPTGQPPPSGRGFQGWLLGATLLQVWPPSDPLCLCFLSCKLVHHRPFLMGCGRITHVTSSRIVPSAHKLSYCHCCCCA